MRQFEEGRLIISSSVLKPQCCPSSFFFLTLALSTDRRPGRVESFWASPNGSVPTVKDVLLRRGGHVLSFKMTVARMRKKVFQPRVTAKPRHTIIRDRPQPGGKIYSYLDTGRTEIDTAAVKAWESNKGGKQFFIYRQSSSAKESNY